MCDVCRSERGGMILSPLKRTRQIWANERMRNEPNIHLLADVFSILLY